MNAEWVEIAEVEDVPRRVDSIEECTCCREKYPWALLTVKIDAQNRVLILCSLCAGKVNGPEEEDLGERDPHWCSLHQCRQPCQACRYEERD